MNSLPRQNEKEALLWNSITLTTMSRFVSMRLLDSENKFFLITSSSKDTLSLNNISYQILINLPILGVFRYTLPLDTHCQ